VTKAEEEGERVCVFFLILYIFILIILNIIGDKGPRV